MLNCPSGTYPVEYIMVPFFSYLSYSGKTILAWTAVHKKSVDCSYVVPFYLREDLSGLPMGIIKSTKQSTPNSADFFAPILIPK